MEVRANIVFNTKLLKKLPLCRNEDNDVFVECEVFANFICDNVDGIRKSNCMRDLKSNTVIIEEKECVPIHFCMFFLYNKSRTHPFCRNVCKEF